MKTLISTFVAVAAAYVVNAGAVVYVSESGSNTEPYDTLERASTTLTNALAYIKGQPIEEGVRPRIKIVGKNVYKSKLDLANVEIFGESWDADSLSVGSTASRILIGENVLIHTLRFTRESASGKNIDMNLYGLFEMSGQSSVISNCHIKGMWTKTVDVGYEVAGNAKAGLITHSLFTENRSNNGGTNGSKTHGAGHISLSGTARMYNCVITKNYHNGNLRGPIDGVVMMSGNAIMENSVVYDNYIVATSNGDKESAVYRNRRGGGIFFTSGSPVVRNTVVRNNRIPQTPSDGKYPTETGEDIYTATVEANFVVIGTSKPIIENCNTSDFNLLPECAVNCQTGDPLFIDPDNTVAQDRDFSILANSPLIDQGRESEWMVGATDYFGNSRYQGGGVDIGVHEVPQDVTSPKAYITIGGEVAAEKYATANMSAFVIGVDRPYECKWYTSDPKNGEVEPFATGMTAQHRFTEGTWSIYFKAVNNETDQCAFASAFDAVVVSRGADYYVKQSVADSPNDKGQYLKWAQINEDETTTGDIDKPFATVEYAVKKASEKALAEQRVVRIKVVGSVQAVSSGFTLNNIELYGDSRTTSIMTAPLSRYYSNAKITMGNNSFLHDLQVKGWRGKGVLTIPGTSTDVIVSNCWFSGSWFTTSGSPALDAKAGLITHTLFTGCTCHYGPVFSIGGNLQMRNSVLTGSNIDDYANSEPGDAIITVSGSAMLENNTIYGNYARKRSDGKQIEACLKVISGTPVIRNNIIRNNRIDVQGSDMTTGKVSNYAVNIDAQPFAINNNSEEGFGLNPHTADPKFVDPDNKSLLNRNFSLQEDSPCIEAGTGRDWRKGATDYMGNPRIQGRRVDIGACEFNSGVVNWGLKILVR